MRRKLHNLDKGDWCARRQLPAREPRISGPFMVHLHGIPRLTSAGRSPISPRFRARSPARWVRRNVQKVVAALRFVQDEFSRYRCAVFTDVWPGYFLRLTSIQRYFNRIIPAGLARELQLRVSMTTTFSRGQRIGWEIRLKYSCLSSKVEK